MRNTGVPLLLLAWAFSSCFLAGRSVLHPVHPKAQVLLENAAEAAFSPDGRYMAFVRLDGGRSWTADIYLLDRETEVERRLTSNPDYDGQPCWAPDSRLLVYTSKRNGRFNLYMTSVETGGERQLTWNGGFQPDFSPDGASILYASDELGNLDLFLTPPSGGIARRLTKHPGRDWYPRYSPDGLYVVFVSNRAGNDDLWLLDRRREQVKRLTSLPGAELHPCWSPDSNLLVFSSSQRSSTGTRRIDLLTLSMKPEDEAIGPLPITACEGISCQNIDPSFGPDGQTLVFTSSFHPLQLRLASLPVRQSVLWRFVGP